jgi:hypothetical protein
LPAMEMRSVSLSGPPNRRIRPEREAKRDLKFRWNRDLYLKMAYLETAYLKIAYIA